MAKIHLSRIESSTFKISSYEGPSVPAEHIMLAHKFVAAGKTFKGCTNDWEIGGGLMLQKVIERNYLNNIVICVACTYSTNKLGNRRFQLIREVAYNAIIYTRLARSPY